MKAIERAYHIRGHLEKKHRITINKVRAYLLRNNLPAKLDDVLEVIFVDFYERNIKETDDILG